MPGRFGTIHPTTGEGPGTIFRAELVGLDEMVERLDKAHTRLKTPRGVAEAIAKIALYWTKRETPIGLTRKLERGLRYRLHPGVGSFLLEIVSDQDYAKYVIFGRGPVRPIRAKALRWVTKGGKVVFAKYAKPSKPNDFPARGWQAARPDIVRQWGDWLQGITEI